MVTLSLLVLLTIAAISMSKKSFKEIRTSGFRRQGAMARNVADSGIEWSIYWIKFNDPGTAAEDAAKHFITLKNSLIEDSLLSGIAKDIFTQGNYKPGYSSDGVGVYYPKDIEQKYELEFTIGLTRMGKMPIVNMSQGQGSGAFTPAAGGDSPQAPDLWAIRSDARVKRASATFTHAKEAWVSTAAR